MGKSKKQGRDLGQIIHDGLAVGPNPPLPTGKLYAYEDPSELATLIWDEMANMPPVKASDYITIPQVSSTYQTTTPRPNFGPRLGGRPGELLPFLEGKRPIAYFQNTELYIKDWDHVRRRWAIPIPFTTDVLYISELEVAKCWDSSQLNSIVEHMLRSYLATERHVDTTPPSRRDTMFEQLLKLYTTYMISGCTSPMPHFVGPPGSGKSTIFQQLAETVGVKLHVVNVSRISPLGLEGLEMPDSDNSALKLLHSEIWTKAREGDIYLFDEFLRGFPEVYNGLLDIFTGREVAGFQLPKVFIAGASNSTATYDKALEDRLLHIPIPDPRKKKAESKRLAKMLIEQLGLLPSMLDSQAMDRVMQDEVHPTFEILDHFDGRGTRNGNTSVKGTSLRKLIGQAKLRHVVSPSLKNLISENNMMAARPGKHQYVLLLEGTHVPAGYESAARALRGNRKLSPAQQLNIELNLQLIEMQEALSEKESDDADDDPTFA